MAHPYHGIVADPLHQRVGRIVPHKLRLSVFTRISRFHGSTGCLGEILCAIAYSEQRPAAADSGQVYLESLRVIYRIRASGKHHADDSWVVGREFVVGINLAIRVQLTYTPCNKLRILRTEVENYDFFLHISVI